MPFYDPSPPHIRSFATTDLISDLIVFCFPGCHISGIIQYVAFGCLASFTQYKVFEIQLLSVSGVHSFLFQCMTSMCLSFYQLVDI